MSISQDPVEPRVGQIWESRDPRDGGRRVTIVAIGVEVKDKVWARTPRGYQWVWIPRSYVRVVNLKTGRTVEIRKDRFRPISTGYRLVEDVKRPPR